MFRDPVRVADAINNPKFHAGDGVVLSDGPHRFTRGVFVALGEDVTWAAVRESNGAVRNHPVDWLTSDSR